MVTARAEYGGTVLGFTSNTRDMTVPGHVGVTFKASPGMQPTAVELALDEAPNLEIMGIYQTGSFTQAEIAAGKWNFAEVELWSQCWDNVNLGELLVLKGNLGKFQDRQTYFNAEIRGLISRLTNDVHAETSRLCRAPKFGDPVYCKKDLTGTVTISATAYNLTNTGRALAVAYDTTDGSIYVSTSGWSAVPPADFFSNGEITFTSGNNSGVSREIAYNEAASGGQMRIWLKRAFPFTGAVGNTVTLIAGCDKTIEKCILYANIVNRRAEDWIPGLEPLNRLP